MAACEEDHEDDPILFCASDPPSTRHKTLSPRRVPRKQSPDPLYPATSRAGVDAVETSDQDERHLLTQQSNQDYWLCADCPTSHTTRAPPKPLRRFNSSATVSPYIESRPYELRTSFVTGDVARSRSNSLATSPAASSAHSTPVSSTAVIALIQGSDNESETSSRGRVLRPRKRIQLQPYTVENASYRATLKLRGQKDAIVRLKDITTCHQFNEYESWCQAPRAADSADDSEFEDGQGYTRRRSSSPLSRTGHVPIFNGISKWKQNKHGRPPDRVTENADDGHYLVNSSPYFRSIAKFPLLDHEVAQATPSSLLCPTLSSSVDDSQPESSQSFSDQECVGAKRAEAKQRKALQRMLPKAVIRRLEREQDRRNQHSRPQNDRKTPTPISGPEHNVAVRGAGMIHRTAQPRRTPLRVMGDLDSESDVTDPSDPDSEPVLLGYDVSSNEHVARLFRREATESEHFRPSRSFFAALPQERSLIDWMLSKPRKRAFPRSRLDRNYDALRTSVPTCGAAMQDHPRGDSTVQPGALPPSSGADVVPAGRDDRKSRRRRRHAANICILRGHQNSCQTRIGRSAKPVSIAVRLIFVTYQLNIVTATGSHSLRYLDSAIRHETMHPETARPNRNLAFEVVTPAEIMISLSL